jgi:hypothetical protein
MGTWSTPSSKEQALELQKLMSKPLIAKNATDLLYDLMGNDELFDALDSIADNHPDSDVRVVVENKLIEWLNNLDDFREEWEPEAVEILHKLADFKFN